MSSYRSISRAVPATFASEEYSACELSNPNAMDAAALLGYPGAGLFGYSHMYGGYAGGQAEYVRVPFADVGPLVIAGRHRG